jgi:hypothetical protein
MGAHLDNFPSPGRLSIFPVSCHQHFLTYQRPLQQLKTYRIPALSLAPRVLSPTATLFNTHKPLSHAGVQWNSVAVRSSSLRRSVRMARKRDISDIGTGSAQVARAKRPSKRQLPPRVAKLTFEGKVIWKARPRIMLRIRVRKPSGDDTRGNENQRSPPKLEP